jgi:hypothetical protein
MSIQIEEQHGVVFSKFDGVAAATELEEYIRRFSAIHARGKPYVGINWMKSYARDRATTERMGRWMKETEAITRQLCAGAAIIAPSPTFRFVLSAVFLVKPMVCPYLVCNQFGEAEAFVRAQADKRRVVLAPVIRNPWSDLG